MKDIQSLTKVEISHIKQLIKKCGLRIQHIGVLLGENRQTVFHDFSGTTISKTRICNYRYLIRFLENLYSESKYFKKSVRETGRMAVIRRKTFALKLNKQFAEFIGKEEAKCDTTTVAKS